MREHRSTAARRHPAGPTSPSASSGVDELSRLIQRTAGFGVQLTDSQDVIGWKNQAILGADYDYSSDQFRSGFSSGPWRRIGP